MAVRSRASGLTRAIGIGFGALAVISLVQSALAMVLYPYWWCNGTGSVTGADNCDTVGFTALAALWLVTGLAVCGMAFLRWNLPVAIIASLLLAVSLTRPLFVGGFYLAPAALWLCCALWQWADGRVERVAVSSVMSVPLLWYAFIGASGLIDIGHLELA